MAQKYNTARISGYCIYSREVTALPLTFGYGKHQWAFQSVCIGYV